MSFSVSVYYLSNGFCILVLKTVRSLDSRTRACGETLTLVLYDVESRAY